MKTVLIHDWLVSLGGAEKVLNAIYSIYPSAIYTLVKKEGVLNKTSFADAKIITSFIQKLPFAMQNHRNYLPFFPSAVESFDLSDFDVILSSSHAVAKGIKITQQQLHICYCHTPMRYAWDLEGDYLSHLSGIKEVLAKWTLSYLRKWDVGNLESIHYFIANSHYIADRIKRVYGRDAEVIYPPVQTEKYQIQQNKEDFYLTMSRLVPYKRVDLIVEAFSKMSSKRLVVIGDGPEMEKLKKIAGKNVELLGFQEDGIAKDYLERARGFVFAAEEDFGIAPVEAQAAGTPVIAYGKGGVLETVIENQTGIFFMEQTATSLIEATHQFEKMQFDPERIRLNAERFNETRFKNEFKQFVEDKWEDFCENYHFSRR
ncbi:MAG TPA: glycosyltransferase [Rhabdochlamydiaceae bacterium]|jgi:glycosyltransferase involved in cell wall biosynthesis|nr:glycosyltransferase [Rhabdochlamydiaceae bacterium]